MKKEDILYWRDRYDKEEDLYNKGDEEELRAKFQKNKYMTKADLERIVKWKFQGRTKGRRKIFLPLIRNVEDSLIVSASKFAFKANNDEERLKLLTLIDGVGNALTSVILAFFDPENYCILDIHAWREAFEVKEEPSNVFSSPKQAIKFFDKIREISKATGLSCRDIEKALFKKNLEESGTKRGCRASTG